MSLQYSASAGQNGQRGVTVTPLMPRYLQPAASGDLAEHSRRDETAHKVSLQLTNACKLATVGRAVT